MENLWEMIAKTRGVELDEEFIWDYKGFKYKHRITTYGLQILVEDKAKGEVHEVACRHIAAQFVGNFPKLVTEFLL